MVEADARGHHLHVGVRTQDDIVKVGVGWVPQGAREARRVKVTQALAEGLEDGPAVDADEDAVLMLLLHENNIKDANGFQNLR